VLDVLFGTFIAGVGRIVRPSNICTFSEIDLFHGRLILGFQIAVEGYVLINRQRLTPGVTGDQLKLGIRQAAMPGQPSDRLVPEGVRGRLDPSLFGVLRDNLLDPPGAELAVPLCLEDPPIVRMSAHMRPKGSGEAFPKEDVAILRALAQVHPDLAGFDINIGDSEVA
jgi:hypothetical protein